jgi:hypothetical protein
VGGGSAPFRPRGPFPASQSHSLCEPCCVAHAADAQLIKLTTRDLILYFLRTIQILYTSMTSTSIDIDRRTSTLLCIYGYVYDMCCAFALCGAMGARRIATRYAVRGPLEAAARPPLAASRISNPEITRRMIVHDKANGITCRFVWSVRRWRP